MVRMSHAKKITADAVAKVIPGANTQLEILKRLGLSASSKNYLALTRAASEGDLLLPARLKRGRPGPRPLTSPAWDESALSAALDGASTTQEVLQRLGMSKGGATTLYRAVRHFGLQLPPSAQTVIAQHRDRIFQKHSQRYHSGQRLRRYLVEEGRPDECASCGLSPSWNGLPLVLHLDHINGDPSDNRRENLRILCPNCHSQTPTYCGNKVKVKSKA